MSCGHCVMPVTKALQALDGVEVQDVQAGSATVSVDLDKTSEQAVAGVVRQAGYEVEG